MTVPANNAFQATALMLGAWVPSGSSLIGGG